MRLLTLTLPTVGLPKDLRKVRLVVMEDRHQDGDLRDLKCPRG